MKAVILSTLVVILLLGFCLPAHAETDGRAAVILSIEARDCSQGMDHCTALADAYIRVVAGDVLKETTTDQDGKATVGISVTTPVAIQVYLNNEVVAEAYAGTISGYYYFELVLDYLPPALYLPLVRGM